MVRKIISIAVAAAAVQRNALGHLDEVDHPIDILDPVHIVRGCRNTGTGHLPELAPRGIVGVGHAESRPACRLRKVKVVVGQRCARAAIGGGVAVGIVAVAARKPRYRL